jgi:hypothetical protein
MCLTFAKVKTDKPAKAWQMREAFMSLMTQKFMPVNRSGHHTGVPI